MQVLATLLHVPRNQGDLTMEHALSGKTRFHAASRAIAPEPFSKMSKDYCSAWRVPETGTVQTRCAIKACGADRGWPRQYAWQSSCGMPCQTKGRKGLKHQRQAGWQHLASLCHYLT